MRSLFAFVLMSSLAACGGSPADGGGGGSVDAPSGGGGSNIGPAVNGFQIKTTEVTIMPGQEITYCYYNHTANTTDTIVKSWQSFLAPGSHHLILYFQNDNGSHADDSLDPSGNCGGADGGTTNLPVWTYSSSQPGELIQQDLPADDGTGKPVGQLVKAGQAFALQLHYINTTDSPISANAIVNGNGYDAGTAYTTAAAYVTYNNSIDIPAGPSTTPVTFSGTCAIPATAKFFTMSTHSHKQTDPATGDIVKDGTSMVVQSKDWEHPMVVNWQDNPFFSFASGNLTYSCTYVNPTSNEIQSGPSAATNEMCMAVGYYFLPGGTANAKICLTQGGQSFVVND